MLKVSCWSTHLHIICESLSPLIVKLLHFISIFLNSQIEWWKACFCIISQMTSHYSFRIWLLIDIFVNCFHADWKEYSWDEIFPRWDIPQCLHWCHISQHWCHWISMSLEFVCILFYSVFFSIWTWFSRMLSCSLKCYQDSMKCPENLRMNITVLLALWTIICHDIFYHHYVQSSTYLGDGFSTELKIRVWLLICNASILNECSPEQYKRVLQWPGL